jgi:hypothetical protein
LIEIFFSHEKAQKAQRKISQRLPKLTDFFATKTARREEKLTTNEHEWTQIYFTAENAESAEGFVEVY